MKISHVAASATFAAATALAACGSDGDSPKAEDAGKSISAERTSHDTRDGSTNAATGPPMKPMTYRELAIAAALECQDADKGIGCTMRNANSEDRYTITFHPGCGKEGAFAVVNGGRVAEDRVDDGGVDDGKEVAELWGTPPGVEMRATLSKGQVVCIQATAYIEGEVIPSYYYVTAVPAAILKSCLHTPLSEEYGNRPIAWHVSRSGPSCRAMGPWSYEGMCATGWVRAGDIAGNTDCPSTTNNVQKELDQ